MKKIDYALYCEPGECDEENKMMKIFKINGHEVAFAPCTAIAVSIGDTTRQKAVFVHDLEDEFGDGDGVIFGEDVPENEEEAASLLEGYIDTYSETLETVYSNDCNARNACVVAYDNAYMRANDAYVAMCDNAYVLGALETVKKS